MILLFLVFRLLPPFYFVLVYFLELLFEVTLGLFLGVLNDRVFYWDLTDVFTQPNLAVLLNRSMNVLMLLAVAYNVPFSE